eukprot:608214-Alexandrium_andersonii.AAC.1
MPELRARALKMHAQGPIRISHATRNAVFPRWSKLRAAAGGQSRARKGANSRPEAGWPQRLTPG